MSLNALEVFGGTRIVPVVVLDDVAQAAPLADALADGGLSSVEVTFRTAAGEDALRRMASTGRLSVGAGTILTAEHVDRAVDAGARFIVSPGLAPDVVERALRHRVAVLPGIATATELQAAVRLGLTAVKLFPVEQLGGLGAVRALAAPFPAMKFMPSGGVTAENTRDYLAHSSVIAVGGSWMVPRGAIAAGDFETVRRLAATAAQLIEQHAESGDR